MGLHRRWNPDGVPGVVRAGTYTLPGCPQRVRLTTPGNNGAWGYYKIEIQCACLITVFDYGDGASLPRAPLPAFYTADQMDWVQYYIGAVGNNINRGPVPAEVRRFPPPPFYLLAASHLRVEERAGREP